jgi:hypothetical protein
MNIYRSDYRTAILGVISFELCLSGVIYKTPILKDVPLVQLKMYIRHIIIELKLMFGGFAKRT